MLPDGGYGILPVAEPWHFCIRRCGGPDNRYLAISNALGSIAVQTAFLGLADLEHAVASVQNMMQIVVLAILLSLVLLAFVSLEITIGHIHPVTPAILLAAISGMVIIYRGGKNPMW